MNFLNALVIFSFFCAANASFFSDDGKWDRLKVKFPDLPNVFKGPPFDKMPLTKAQAIEEGFKKIGSECSGEFQGYRYLKNNDPALYLLYDVNGNIAGIQTSFAENKIKKSKIKAWFQEIAMFTKEETPSGKYYTLTAYFTNPDDICTSGRSKENVKQNPSGDNLYFKNGTTNILIPKYENGIEKSKWILGKCAPLMGTHYWYRISKDMNCDYFQPYFLLYKDNKLAGFGFAVFGKFKSPRYENPPTLSFGLFIKKVPKCLKEISNEIGVSTLHVYLNKPQLICPLFG